MNIRKLFLTFFYIGLAPKAPGTFSTLAAVPFAFATLFFLSPATLFLLSLLLLVAGIAPIKAYEAQQNCHDPKEIVIDEVAGIFMTYSFVLVSFETDPMKHLTLLFFGFVFFRLLDIYKPSIIGRCEKIKNGWGVMLDDVVAGFFAGLLVALTSKVYDLLF